MTSLLFTQELKAAAGNQWETVVGHKFTKELAAGTIDRRVLTKYLIQDYRFLDAFCVLLGSIVAHARSLEDRIPACQFLGVVTSAENTYFTRCFDKLNVTDQDRLAVPNAKCTTDFCNLMTEVALQGTLAEMLSVIVVCEWTYLSWADRVKDETNRDDFVTYEWVDLHSGAEFEGVVAYFRALLDKEGALLSEEERKKCKGRFLQAMQLEQDFFDMAYEGME
jgi:thiaminase/transcriptional activator TenA